MGGVKSIDEVIFFFVDFNFGGVIDFDDGDIIREFS